VCVCVCVCVQECVMRGGVVGALCVRVHVTSVQEHAGARTGLYTNCRIKSLQ
jgi:hypothetical protein